MTIAGTMALNASDITGNCAVRATGIPFDATVSELVSELLAKMNLGRHDAYGNPIRYRAHLERESRHLDGYERVGEALKPEDHVLLSPSIDAGC